MATGARAPTASTEEDRARAICAIDPQLRRIRPLETVTAAIRRPDLSLAELLTTVMEAYADRPEAGERAREVVRDPVTGRRSVRLLPRFDTVTYGDLWSRVRALMADLHHDGAAPLAAGGFMAILGFGSIDFMTVDLACMGLGAVLVPLSSAASPAQLAPIVAETGPRVLATGLAQLDTAVTCAMDSGSVRRVLVFDYDDRVDDQRERLDAARARLAAAGAPIALAPLSELVEHGRTLPEVPLYSAGPGGNPLRLLVYTSGSTGTPKGSMRLESTVRGTFVGPSPTPAYLPLITLNYLPLSHGAGRMVLLGTLGAGGTCHFTARSDLSTFFEDLALVRPTDLLLVPRVCDMFFQRYHSELERRVAAGADRTAADLEVRRGIRDDVLGGRLLRIAVGSAPLSAEMTAFIESCADQALRNIYASTEAGLITVDGRVVRPPVVDYRLVDVPELGYHRTDVPHPRGELLLKSRSVTPGYYKRPDATAEVFDADGYYRTGDIMAEVGPDRLVFADRRNNVLKLSQGEFVAVARLEAVYATSPLVHQIYVYGNSERAYLLAVVVPTADALARFTDPAELTAAVLTSLRDLARAADLHPYEIPRDIVVETEPFSTVNGLLSDIRKQLRHRLKEKYGPRLEQVYARLAEREAAELSALRHGGHDRPVLETLRRAAQALLGGSSAEISAEAPFTDLGGDSLTALSYATLLSDIFGVEIPVGTVLGPAGNLSALASYVDSALASGVRRPTFATVHGAHASEVRAADLTLDRFVDAGVIAAAAAPPPPTGPPRTVLLTGATGYLGRFLCLELLRSLDRTGGTLVCLVRGASAGAAAGRLAAAFDSGDPELLETYGQLADRRLEVLPGDVSEPNLGLPAETWDRLAETVDLIVHAGALVNHVLPYERLFAPNVAGTAELIRLALTTRLTPFAYVSSVAVLTTATGTREDDDIRVTNPVRSLHAGGYATSKWAGEVLLREAHDRCGLPVTCFRSDMILAHRHYTGQLNVPDMFTRLLLSIATTGLAPRSFYRADDTGRHRSGHYDGLPVDFTAAAIAALATGTTSGYRTFNVVNPHDDGASLDAFVDWLIDAGLRVHRVEDFATWRTQLDTALRALPDRLRRRSLLPLKHAYATPAEPVAGSATSADRFRGAVWDAGIGPGRDIPHITPELITKYVTDLRHLGLL
ncbi:carboxylic acid reductase [Virgisporangium ochraceum]